MKCAINLTMTLLGFMGLLVNTTLAAPVTTPASRTETTANSAATASSPSPATPQKNQPTPNELPKQIKQLVDRIVDQLGNDSYQKREQAQKAMMKLPDNAVPHIARLYLKNQDAEIKWRIEMFAELFFDQKMVPKYLGQPLEPSFLGVTHTATTLRSKQKAMNGKLAILINTVHPNTGAAKAGIKAGDVVTAVDGKPFNNASDPTGEFIQKIMVHQPGDQLKLDILRKGKAIKVTAILGKRPKEAPTVMSINKAVQIQIQIQILRKLWWEKAFLKGQIDLPKKLVESTLRSSASLRSQSINSGQIIINGPGGIIIQGNQIIIK